LLCCCHNAFQLCKTLLGILFAPSSAMVAARADQSLSATFNMYSPPCLLFDPAAVAEFEV